VPGVRCRDWLYSSLTTTPIPEVPAADRSFVLRLRFSTTINSPSTKNLTVIHTKTLSHSNAHFSFSRRLSFSLRS
jgi:hypothetical protein